MTMSFTRRAVAALFAATALTAVPALAQQAEVKIGYNADQSASGAAELGLAGRYGFEAAIEDINAKNPEIAGKKVKFVLVAEDDVADPKQGVSVANKFVGDGVTFVVGHFNSSVSIPASEVYAENGILQVTPASTNPSFTERGLWNTFRVCGRDDQQGAVAGKYIAEKLSGKKVAVLGQTVVTELFGEGVDPVGQRIRLGPIPFTVIGVLAPKGQSGFQDQDEAPIVPGTSAMPAAGAPAAMMPDQQLPIDQVAPQRVAPVDAGMNLAGGVPDTSGPDGMQAGIETPIIE